MSRRFPLAPLAATAVVLIVGGGYLTWSRRGDSGRRFRHPPARDVLRVVAADLSAASTAPPQPDRVAALITVLRTLAPQIIALQGLPTREAAASIAAALGPYWIAEAVPVVAEGAGSYVAILADGRLGAVDQFLVPATPARQALAFEILVRGTTVRLIAAQPLTGQSSVTGQPDAHGGGVSVATIAGILSWCDRRPQSAAGGAGLTVVALPALDWLSLTATAPATQGQLSVIAGWHERFAEVSQFPGARAQRNRRADLYIHPQSASVLASDQIRTPTGDWLIAADLKCP